ncbi:MAG TPA: L,D-transpeptidase [Bdellovibrio sp.]|uniref:L,D-transpeptidase n=1 Tax=Bdellovibrio sp. TaxID=28201 RepID=UPI002F1E2BD7
MSKTQILVSAEDQKLTLLIDGKPTRLFSVSTAMNGLGCEIGSNKTPTGRLKIHKKIGGEFPKGAIFRARVHNGEICTPGSSLWQSSEDLVTSRVLWLEGCENHNANTLGRYIYLHGTNQEHLLGKPVSHGCIRLSNKDIIELYDLVEEGTEVLIVD